MTNGNGSAILVANQIQQTVEAEITVVMLVQRVREAESRAVRQFVKWAAEGAWKGRMCAEQMQRIAEEMQTYLIEA